MFHRRFSNCRPQNSTWYNRIICQTLEKVSFLESLPCILHAFATGYQGYKSNFGFRVPFNRETCPANLGLKVRYWIRRKEHTLNFPTPDLLFSFNTITFQKYFWCSRFSWFDCKTSDFLMNSEKNILCGTELFETLTIFFHVLVYLFLWAIRPRLM